MPFFEASRPGENIGGTPPAGGSRSVNPTLEVLGVEPLGRISSKPPQIELDKRVREGAKRFTDQGVPDELAEILAAGALPAPSDRGARHSRPPRDPYAELTSPHGWRSAAVVQGLLVAVGE